MLGVQTLSVVCLFFWGLLATFPIIWGVNKILPIRLTAEDEIMGCDIIEHYMGDEKEVLQILALRELGVVPSVNLNLSHNNYNVEKDAERVSKRRPYRINLGYEHEDIAQESSSARL